MRALVCLVIAGCGYAPTPATGDGAVTADQLVEGDTIGGEGTVAMALVDRGLVARYFVNEAASGQAPAGMVDAATNPVNMPLIYVGADPAYTVVNGHRGLEWTSTAGTTSARPELIAQNTKLRDNVTGRASATIEVVADIQEATTLGSRLFHLGQPDDSGLDFRITSTTAVDVFWDGPTERTIAYDLNPASPGRVVYHAVFDLSAANIDDRVRIYRNGARQTQLTAGPPLGDLITLADVTDLGCSFGNRGDGTRSFRGVLFYGAVYNVALSDGEIGNNVAYLADNDDS